MGLRSRVRAESEPTGSRLAETRSAPIEEELLSRCDGGRRPGGRGRKVGVDRAGFGLSMPGLDARAARGSGFLS